MKRLFATAVFAGVLGLLLAFTARAAEVNKVNPDSGTRQTTAEGIVVPDSIYDRQPFSFAATQAIAGEVVSINTADGVVVERSSADRYGRVFLSEGLAAGVYLISRSGSGQPVGQIEIKPRASNVGQRPGDHQPQPMQLQNPPNALRLSDPWSLSGRGFNSNYTDMRVTLSAAGREESPVILAATEDQLKLAPVQQLSPGSAQLRVTNGATGASTDAHDLLLYDIHGDLVRRSIRSGVDQTQLIISTRPENQPLTVKVSVTSGPVDFGGGRKETQAVTSNGQAVFPVHAEHGAGPFQLSWNLASSDPCREEAGPSFQEKQDWEKKAQDEEDAADKAEKAGDPDSAAQHREKAAAYRRSAGEGDKAADDEEQRAEDYRNAAKGKKHESDQKKLRDQAAEAEQNAARDHESEAEKKLKCKDKKGAADEYRQAQRDYERAADAYDKTHEASKKRDMTNKAAADKGKAEQLDAAK